MGAGVKKLDETFKPLPKLLPRKVTWLHDSAEAFDPCENLVHTCQGDKIYYEFMVVAVGIKNDYDKVIPNCRNGSTTYIDILIFWPREYHRYLYLFSRLFFFGASGDNHQNDEFGPQWKRGRKTASDFY